MSLAQDPLGSARQVLARAKQHTLDLKRQNNIYFGSDPYTKVVEIDAKTGDHLHKIKLTKPMPFELNLIAADAVQNVRTVLEHVGYAVSVSAGGKGKNTHFPFGDTAAEVTNRKRGGSAEIPNEIFDLMSSFKPYRGGNNLLWALNKLNNANKHRLVTPVAMHAGAVRVHKFSVTGTGGAVFPRFDPVKHEMLVARVTPETDISYDMEVKVFIVFRDIQALIPHDAIGLLDAMTREVESILMAVEAEARRIGIFH